MKCEACGSGNAADARYCGSCGATLVGVCPSCGAGVEAGRRFCSACGFALARGEPEPAPPTVARPAAVPGLAERRRVSVLFVDLESFTSLAESLDPEELRRVQSRYFEAARSVVAGHGGTIEKFIGDAVMAVWGAPAAHEDDPERAVRAALAIVDEVSRLGGAVADRGLQARAAVASGQAAVTIGVLGEGMVAGDLVNVAARLQPHAPPGGVLVDRATRELAPEAATYEPIGTLTLKGRSAGVDAFHARPRPAADAGRVRGSHAGPFVGREDELAELVALYESVAASGGSRLVSITGIAGIGKSRLAWEFGEWIDALPEIVAWHAARAPAYGEGITFAAVAEMVRRRIRVADDAPPEVAARQLAASLDELVRDPGERRWLEPRLAVLLSRQEDHDFERDELFAAWRRFFERVSDRSPAVLVFEDLHWADEALLDFVEHLATWTRNHPILILALARPELLDRRPGWGTGVSRFTSIHLERLSDEALRSLLLGRVPELPESLVRSVLKRAGGVPLYAVEVVRALADRGDAAKPTQPGVATDADVEIPDSLAGVISARIDALPLAERRLLLSAAVLGRRFRFEALVAVGGGSPALVRERLELLLRRELLELDEEPGSPGRGSLAFVQDLVRDIAYRTLGHDDRRALHLAAAHHFEAQDDPSAVAALARHLLEAHRLAPQHPDAARIARRAVGALQVAARDAMRVHSPLRALEQFEQALNLVADAVQRASLLEATAAAARDSARLDVAERHLRELVALRTGADDAAGAARARAQLASVLLMAQRNEVALVELEEAVAAVQDADADPAGAEVAAQLARARMLIGDPESGLEWAERAIGTARAAGLDGVAADATVTHATALVRLGRVEAGLRELREAVEMAREGGHLGTELRARNNLAWLLVADDPRMTLETARAGLEVATEMGIGDLAAQLAEVACAAALETGDWDWALETTDEILGGPVPEANRVNLIVNAAAIGALAGRSERVAALDELEPLPPETDPQIVAGVRHARAWAALVAGSLEEAQQLAGEAAAGSFGEERAQQLALQARASLWLGDRETAARALEVMAGERITGRAFEATVATLSAGIAALDGTRDPAGHLAAADRWRALDLPLHLALCLLDAQRLLGDAAPDRAELLAALDRLGAAGLSGLAGVSLAH